MGRSGGGGGGSSGGFSGGGRDSGSFSSGGRSGRSSSSGGGSSSGHSGSDHGGGGGSLPLGEQIGVFIIMIAAGFFGWYDCPPPHGMAGTPEFPYAVALLLLMTVAMLVVMYWLTNTKFKIKALKRLQEILKQPCDWF